MFYTQFENSFCESPAKHGIHDQRVQQAQTPFRSQQDSILRGVNHSLRRCFSLS